MTASATDTTTVPAMSRALTRDDIKAMRQADDVCFYHTRTPGHNDRPGQQPGTIRLVKRVRNPGPFDDRERRHDIEGLASAVSIHDDRRPYGDRGYNSCFAMRHSVQFCDCWKTIVAFVKVGDILELAWSGSDNNQYLNRVGESGALEALHHDKLYLTIKRKGKRYQFWVNDSICPNNTARMIRPL